MFVEVMGFDGDAASFAEIAVSIREAFLYGDGSDECRRSTWYRLAQASVLHPSVATGSPEATARSAHHPQELILLDFADRPAFLRWRAGPGRSIPERIDGARARRVLHARYLRLPGGLRRGEGAAPRFVNWVGLSLVEPEDPEKVDAWLRVYARYMTSSVFGSYPQIRYVERYQLVERVTESEDRSATEIPPTTLTAYGFDSWDDFVRYHHDAQETEEGLTRTRERKAWAERAAGVVAPKTRDVLFRAQYEVVETLRRT